MCALPPPHNYFTWNGKDYSLEASTKADRKLSPVGKLSQKAPAPGSASCPLLCWQWLSFGE